MATTRPKPPLNGLDYLVANDAVSSPSLANGNDLKKGGLNPICRCSTCDAPLNLLPILAALASLFPALSPVFMQWREAQVDLLCRIAQ